VAEAWAEFRNNHNPHKWEKFIGQLIESKYKEKFGKKI